METSFREEDYREGLFKPKIYKNGTYSFTYTYGEYLEGMSFHGNPAYTVKTILYFNKNNKCFRQVVIIPVNYIYDCIESLNKNFIKIGKMRWENIALGTIHKLKADGKYAIHTIYKSYSK